MEISLRRPLSSDALSVEADASTKFRFTGPEVDEHAGHDHPPGEHPETDFEAMAAIFAYDLPPGWEKLPATEQRWINLQPQGNPDAAVTVSIMPGEAGGLVANVDRWRQQVGLGPANQADLDALETRLVLGAPASYLDVRGRFVGMGDEDVPDARLVGLIQTFDAGSPTGESAPFTLFIKFTGPAALVAEELEAFDMFVASLRGAGADSAGDAGAPSAPGIQYTVPEGWSDEGASGMRIVDLLVEGAELSVIELAGPAGGIVDNVNRWRKQLGLGPFSEAQVEQMERIPALGTEGYLFDATGSYQGMTGGPVPDARMIGALVIGPDKSYFVKFVGPADVVTREAGAFRAVLDSLEVAP